MAAIGLLAIELGGCDPYTKVSGVVRQPSGAPLAEVTVVLSTAGREPHQVKTGNDGAFEVGIVGADPRVTYISFARARSAAHVPSAGRTDPAQAFAEEVLDARASEAVVAA